MKHGLRLSLLKQHMMHQGHHHLCALHELCWALRDLRLHRLDCTQAPRLAAFGVGQAAALDAAGAALAGFGAAAAKVMAAACAETLQALQTRLDLFAQRQVRTRPCGRHIQSSIAHAS